MEYFRVWMVGSSSSSSSGGSFLEAEMENIREFIATHEKFSLKTGMKIMVLAKGAENVKHNENIVVFSS